MSVRRIPTRSCAGSFRPAPPSPSSVAASPSAPSPPRPTRRCRRAARPNSWSTCRPPGSTACPAPSWPRADLGLPALPGRPVQAAPISPPSLSGTHTLRVWYSGPDQARVALLDTLGETDVITNGTDVWIWSSKDNTATHATIAGRRGNAGRHAVPGPSRAGWTDPEAWPRPALAVARTVHRGHHERLGVGGRARRVRAGPRAPRPGLPDRLDPRWPSTRPSTCRCGWRCYARGSDDPAIEVAFTQVSFDRPDASQFTFNPPPGATVIEETPDAEGHDPDKPDAPSRTLPSPARPSRTRRRPARSGRRSP